MKKLLVTMTAFFGFVGAEAVQAADLPRPVMKAPPIARPACAQFGGFYLGGHAGWNYYRHDWKDLDNYGFNFTFQDHVGDGSNADGSWHAGVQAGYNWQSGCTVWGVQVDWSWTKAEAESLHQDFPGVGANTLVAHSELKWFGTARARTGFVVENLLLYVTGGVAFARFDREFTYTFAPDTQIFSSGRTRIGYVVGVGTEWAITPNWSLNSEFLYMGFEKDSQAYACSAAATCAGLPVSTPWRYEHIDSVWVGRIGLNYRFGGAPVVASY